MSLRRLDKTSWRYIEDVLKTFLKIHNQGEYIRLDQDVLNISSQDEDESRQDIFKMSSSRRMFAGKPTSVTLDYFQ